MLKTSSKKARENIRAYIMDGFTPESYDNPPPESADFPTVARFILDVFQQEKYYSAEYIRAKHIPVQDVFMAWAQGLPSVIDTCYYYNRSAVTDLGNLLEESEQERSRYSESEAETLLTRLIYRELVKAAGVPTIY